MVVCRVYSLITGRRMVSLPFSDHCEPLFERPEQLQDLLHSVELDCISERCKYLEIRTRTVLTASPKGLQSAQVFCSHSVDLTPGIEDIFRRLHKDSTQRKIRRAERESVIYEEGRSEALLEKFYQLILRTRRRHHLPPPPRVWFRNLLDCLGENIRLSVASKDGQTIASIVTLYFKDVLVYKYGCSDERFHNLGGTHLLLWNALQAGKKKGAREFDLGRSDCENAGLITFKDRWGAARSELTYWRYPASTVARSVLPSIPDPLLTAALRTRMAKRIFPLIPDRILIVASRLFYKHLGCFLVFQLALS